MKQFSLNLKSEIKFKTKEIEMAKKTWSQLKDFGLYECGISLMTMILIEHKELKTMWRKRRQSRPEHIDADDIPRNPLQIMKDHGVKVFETIELAVNSLDDFKSIASIFNEMAYKHYEYGARIEHVEICAEAAFSTIDSVLKEEFTEKCRSVWIKILSLIIMEMKIGMMKAENES